MRIEAAPAVVKEENMKLYVCGIPIEVAYDQMSKEEFIAHVERAIKSRDSQIERWKDCVELYSISHRSRP